MRRSEAQSNVAKNEKTCLSALSVEPHSAFLFEGSYYAIVPSVAVLYTLFFPNHGWVYSAVAQVYSVDDMHIALTAW